jgi:nucleotide-binding universal stress UspA family protein
MGSVAEKVLRATANPLLLVRTVTDRKTTGETRWQSVIVPLDGSELAELVLPSVVTLAREMKLEVRLARAYEIPAAAYYGSEDYLPNYEAIKKEIREEARDYLLNKTEGLKKAGAANVSWVLLDGPAADELIKLGRSTPDNLIAMSTHGRSGVKSLGARQRHGKNRAPFRRPGTGDASQTPAWRGRAAGLGRIQSWFQIHTGLVKASLIRQWGKDPRRLRLGGNRSERAAFDSMLLERDARDNFGRLARRKKLKPEVGHE